MLKHVQTSPHRHLSSSSLKKTFSGQDSPKHARQSSSPSLLFVSRPSPSPSSGSESSWPQTNYSSSSGSSFCSKNDTISTILKESDDDSFEPLPPPTYNRCGKRNSQKGNKISSDRQPVCPNCLKKKKCASNTPENVPPLVRRKSDFGVVPLQEVSSVTCSNLNHSLQCISVKNGNSCICSRDYLKKFQKCVTIQYQNNNGTNIHISQSRISTPSSSEQMGLLEEETSESQTSSSSSIASKSPKCHPRAKSARGRLLEDKRTFSRHDNLSLDSSMSCSTTSQEDHHQPSGSLSSSAISLQDNTKQSMVRVWVRCLLQEMEYKTLCVSYSTTCRQVVSQLLSKFRMKHRDPNLFYLAMEVTIRKAGAEVRQCLRLDDSAYPAQLVECHPKEDSRLALRMRRGGLLRIYDEALSQGSHYKSLLVGEKTSCVEVVALVLACNKVLENVHNYTLFEVWPSGRRERVLQHSEEPMVIASLWTDKESVRFEIRKHPPKLTKAMPPPSEVNLKTNSTKGETKNDNLGSQFHQDFSNRNLTSEIKWKEKSSLDTCDDSSSGIASSISSSSSPCPPEDLKGALILPASQPLPNKPKRKLPMPPPKRHLIETSVDEVNSPEGGSDPESSSSSHGFKTYNDYENYFYI